MTNPDDPVVRRFAPPHLREGLRDNMVERLTRELEEAPRTTAGMISAAAGEPSYVMPDVSPISPSHVERAQSAESGDRFAAPPLADDDPIPRRSKAQTIIDRQLAVMLAFQRVVGKLDRAALGARGRDRMAAPARPEAPETVDGFWPALERLTVGLERLAPALDRHADEQLALFDQPGPARMRIG